MLFFLFLIHAVKWELPFLLSVWRGREEKKKTWKMLASDKIQRSSFSYVVNEWLSALPFAKALNPACKQGLSLWTDCLGIRLRADLK